MLSIFYSSKETPSKVMHEKAPTKDGYSSDDEKEDGKSEDEEEGIEKEKSAEEKAYEQVSPSLYLYTYTIKRVRAG